MGYFSDPSPDELARIYQKAWRDSQGSGRFAAGSTTKEIAKSLVTAMLGREKPGTCLDYGGGGGGMALALVEMGADVYVVEPYGSTPDLENVTWVQSLGALPAELRFDHIFLVEVIEHLLDPVGLLANLKQYLAPSTGKLVITTPNAKSWRARASSTEWREAQNPTHINLFTPTSLEVCLQRAGYGKVRRIRRQVRYHKTGLENLVLGLTQLLGIDGGLRVTAERDS